MHQDDQLNTHIMYTFTRIADLFNVPRIHQFIILK